MSSVVDRREPPCDPKTVWVRLDQRREIDAWIRCKMRCLNRYRFGSSVEPTTHCFFIRSKLRQRSRAPFKYLLSSVSLAECCSRLQRCSDPALCLYPCSTDFPLLLFSTGLAGKAPCATPGAGAVHQQEGRS